MVRVSVASAPLTELATANHPTIIGTKQTKPLGEKIGSPVVFGTTALQSGGGQTRILQGAIEHGA